MAPLRHNIPFVWHVMNMYWDGVLASKLLLPSVMRWRRIIPVWLRASVSAFAWIFEGHLWCTEITCHLSDGLWKCPISVVFQPDTTSEVHFFSQLHPSHVSCDHIHHPRDKYESRRTPFSPQRSCCERCCSSCLVKKLLNVRVAGFINCIWCLCFYSLQPSWKWFWCPCCISACEVNIFIAI